MLDISNVKHAHCVGIGGIGLSAIAHILLSRGIIVTGSDLKESETTASLEKAGAKIFYEHKSDNVDGSDLLIYSAAAHADNAELKTAKDKNIPIASRAEVLGILMDEYESSIAVSGTHGKTTTTSMISLVLKHAEKDPTILVGGNLSELNGNVMVGKSQYFITEACEYVDSFLSLKPKIEIILNIDSDHLDYFKDMDHIVSSFDKFARLVPKEGTVIGYAANPFVVSVINQLECNVVTFGFDQSCDYCASNIVFNVNGMPSFDILKGGTSLCTMQLCVPGEHNIANALAAFTCCHHLGIDAATIKHTLEGYTGTQRRFDIIGTTAKGVKVVDDYAHHPTEIKATLKAAKNLPHAGVWCLFQPHTYTRTLALFDDFANSFENADKVVLAEIYAAREHNIHKISSKSLADRITELHPEKEVYYFASFEEINNFVSANASAGDLVLTMGAGDIYKVGDMLMANPS